MFELFGDGGVETSPHEERWLLIFILHPLQLCTQKALAMAVRTVMMNWITFDMFSFFI